MPKLTMLVGPPGSGKSTFAKDLVQNDGDNGANTVYVNQDSQGKFGHMEMFRESLHEGKNIICDRMNFNKAQRNGYIEQARTAGYEIEIHVLHVPYAVCLERAIARQGHETIKDEASARQAINFFFRTYERVEDWEANEVIRHWPEGDKPSAIYSDLDGTLCDCSHRRHHVRTEGKKKNWMAFMDGIKDDSVNQPVMDVLNKFKDSHQIVYCSGRSTDVKQATVEWLHKYGAPSGPLFMRMQGDSRQDAIVKEILLDFEILTRFSVLFCLDDRDQVVKMLRNRGLTVFQVAEGDF